MLMLLLDTIHKQPGKSDNTDFSRVRLYALDGLNKYYRKGLWTREEQLFESTFTLKE